jgi:hypothetical protein
MVIWIVGIGIRNRDTFCHLLKQVSPNHSAEESGMALARLLTDPALAGTTARYFEGQKEIPSSGESYDERRAAKLWDDSKLLVNL